MGYSANSNISWGVVLDEMPWTDDEEEVCNGDRDEWLAGKLELGDEYWKLEDDAWPVRWVRIGDGENESEIEGQQLLAIPGLSASGCWEAPTEINTELFNDSRLLEGQEAIDFAWSKIKPGEEAPKGKWLLTAYYG